MPSDCYGVSCFQQNFEKKLRIYLWSLAIFTFLWVLAPSWQHLVLAKPSQTILSIDRSEWRFESHTGDKIRKTLKNNENLDVFC